VTLSHVQLGGTVPIFWEQFGVKEDVHVTRPADVTRAPFKLHMEDLVQSYGSVFVLNLLKAGSDREIQLSNGFYKQIYESEPNLKCKIKYHNFDFAQYCKGEKFDNLKLMV
jgi:hypothetical protein